MGVTRTTRRLAVLALCCMAACGGGDTPAEPEEPGNGFERPTLGGTWTAGPRLPASGYRPAVAYQGSDVYVLGGARGSFGTDEATTDQVLRSRGGGPWEIAPAYPIDGMDVGLYVHGGTLFGIGGLAFPSKRWDRLFRLDAAGEGWERLDFGDEPRGGLSAVVIGDTLVVLEQEGSGALWIQDLETGAWSQGAARPDPRSKFGVAVHGREVFAVFGRPGFAAPIAVNIDAYEVDTGLWRRVAASPSILRDVGVAELDGRIHVFGGATELESSTATHLVYDLATGTWLDGPPLPEARAGLVAVEVDGTIWVMGGAVPGASPVYRTHVWMYAPPG